jgi:iron complex outermembrane receptor protein
VKLRGGFNRATRSPNIQELFEPQGLELGGSQDICAGAQPTATREQCERLGVPAAQYGTILENPAGQYNTLEGGNPNLEQELAETLSGGVVFTPRALPGFTAALDYYNIKVEDTIDQLEADDVMNQCAATGNPTLCNLIHRDRLGTLWLFTDGFTISTNQNVGKRESQGIDVNAAYLFSLGRHGSLTTTLIGTFLMNQKIDTGLFAYDCVGLYGNQCGIPTPRWRHLARFSWDTTFNTTFSVGWRVVGPVENDDLSSNPAIGDPGNISLLELNDADKIGTFSFLDVATAYRLGPSYTLLAGVNNIFDKEPPLGAGASDNDFGPGFYGTYDHLGRYVFTGIQFTF